MKKIRLLSLILTLGVAVQSIGMNAYAADDTVQKIYVRENYAGSNEAGTIRAPFNTIEEAKAAAVQKLAYSDVEILVGDGEYFLTEAVDFNSSQIGNTENSLTIKPYQTGNVVISGGEKLDNSSFVVHDSTKNIYKIPYKSTIQRQLYVNGAPAIRSRSTENDFTFGMVLDTADADGDGNTTEVTAITASNTAVASWNIANIAEIVFKNSFVSPRRFVTGVTVQDGVAKFEIKHGTYILEQAYPLTRERGGIFWLENALEVLDEPGEWCHDGQYIYYKLRDGEDISTAEIILPKLDSSAVSFTGTAAKPIKNITVEGITFAHNTWMHVSKEGWLNPSQSNVVQGQPEPFGIVNTTYAENVVFRNCKFTNGGGSGITIMDGSKNVTVTGCEISNISSAGILVGSIQNDRYGKPETQLVRNVTIENNVIHDCAIDYYSATGIAVAYEKDVKILHNEIYNLPYSGLHLGCGWNYAQTTDVENIIVKYNYLHDCMQYMHDGGLIYTLGATNQEAGTLGKRNEIAYNYLKDVKSDGVYLYHDNGSSYWNTHHNVIHQTDSTKRAWFNTAPDTHDISIHNNFTNVSYETTTGRVEDSLLIDMFNKTNVAYEMSESGTPTANGYSLEAAEYVIKNAGRKSTVLYDIADVKDTITLDNAVFMNDDILLHDGGSASIDTAMVGGALSFMLYAGDNSAGSLEISVDDKYKFVVTKTDVTLYENGTKRTEPISATGWSKDGYTDFAVIMTETGLNIAYGNLTRMRQTASIAEGKVKIKANGMSALIGALPRHYSLTANDLELYGGDINKSVVTNGYFETDVSGWTGTSATLTRDTATAYGDSLASMKVAETSTYSTATAQTTATLSGGKWYRISAMIKMADGYTSGSATAKFTSSAFSTSLGDILVKKDPNIATDTQTYANFFRNNFFGKEYTLNSGWNKVTDYVMVDSQTNVTLGIVVSGQRTYYVDNFEVVEEAPMLTEYGFENGIGCWKGTSSYATLSLSNNGYTGKALKVTTKGASYIHALRPVHLEIGKTYTAKAKIYLESLTSGADKANVLFSAHQYYNYVNQTDQYGYQMLTDVPVGQWTDMEFTFTWKASEQNAPAFIKMKVEDLGTWYIDDVELSVIPEQKIRTENADFISRTNGWEYNGISSLDFTTGEGVKVTPKDASSAMYQEISMLSGVDYYAEGFVKLEENVRGKYTIANILVTDESANASMTSTDFARRGKNMRSTKQVITSDKWTKIGGIIRLDSDAITTPVSLGAEVKNDDNTVPAYSIKGLKIIPVSDMTTTRTNPEINDGKVTYSATGTGKVRYSYYSYDIYNDAYTKTKSGYVNAGEALPDIGKGKAYALITTTATNGADEITEIAETADVSMLAVTKENGKVSIKAAGNNPQNKEFILGIYSADGEELKKVTIENGEYLNGQITYDDVLENFEIKAFIWDMALLEPMCDVLSVTTE